MMSSIKVCVYPVNSIHGFLVWLFGHPVKRVTWRYIHWTIELKIADNPPVVYHLTGNGVSNEPERGTPTEVWEFPIDLDEAIQILDRIQTVIDRRVICSYQSMLTALVCPETPRVDTCISFVLYCMVGVEDWLANYPLYTARVLSNERIKSNI